MRLEVDKDINLYMWFNTFIFYFFYGLLKLLLPILFFEILRNLILILLGYRLFRLIITEEFWMKLLKGEYNSKLYFYANLWIVLDITLLLYSFATGQETYGLLFIVFFLRVFLFKKFKIRLLFLWDYGWAGHFFLNFLSKIDYYKNKRWVIYLYNCHKKYYGLLNFGFVKKKKS